MNTNHATGPWMAEKHPLGHYGIFQRDHAHQIAEVFDRNTSPEMVEANANLIAAAPDMVSALIKMHEAGKEGGVHEDDWYMCLLSETITKALGPDWQNDEMTSPRK